jgi:hypothetical protein
MVGSPCLVSAGGSSSARPVESTAGSAVVFTALSEGGLAGSAGGFAAAEETADDSGFPVGFGDAVGVRNGLCEEIWGAAIVERREPDEAVSISSNVCSRCRRFIPPVPQAGGQLTSNLGLLRCDTRSLV